METTQMMVTECAYCGREVAETYNVPSSSDDEAWAKIWGEHGQDCEWAATRAHSVEDPRPLRRALATTIKTEDAMFALDEVQDLLRRAYGKIEALVGDLHGNPRTQPLGEALADLASRIDRAHAEARERGEKIMEEHMPSDDVSCPECGSHDLDVAGCCEVVGDPNLKAARLCGWCF